MSTTIGRDTSELNVNFLPLRVENVLRMFISENVAVLTNQPLFGIMRVSVGNVFEYVILFVAAVTFQAGWVRSAQDKALRIFVTEALLLGGGSLNGDARSGNKLKDLARLMTPRQIQAAQARLAEERTPTATSDDSETVALGVT